MIATRQMTPIMAMVLWVGTGCAARTAAYEPVSPTARADMGLPATTYTIRVDHTRMGTVKAWSDGGYQETLDGRAQPVVDVRLRIRNDSDGPITLDTVTTDLELVTTEGSVVVVEAPARIDGSTTVEAGAIERMGLIYLLPSGIEPGSVATFELNWALNTGKGRYSQSTPFRQEGQRGAVYLYNPYWYGPSWNWPYWGGPFGDDDWY